MIKNIFTASRDLPSVELKFEQPEVCASARSGHAPGTPAQIDSWTSTDFIDISGAYGILYELHAEYRVISAAFFDADRGYLGGIGISGGCDKSGRAAALSGFARIPDGAVYAKFAKYAGSERRFPIPYPFVSLIPDAGTYGKFEFLFPYHDKKIACIGDSLTEGDYGYRYGVGYIYGYNFPFFLSRELGCHVDNYGICGTTSTAANKNFAVGFFPVPDADVITVILGTNRGLEGALGDDYNALIDQILAAKKPGAKLVLCTPPHVTRYPHKSGSDTHKNVERAAEIVRDIAAQRGLDLIDIHRYGPLKDENEDVYQSNDGVHMTEQGYRALAAFISVQLRERKLI